MFNPRVEYTNQWLPVGPDPLKNEPTFDYSPPTLERVRYWSEFSEENNNNDDENGNKTENSNKHEKSEILLLGVPMKHTIYPNNAKKHPNQLTQTEPKSSNRRSSAYYPPEVKQKSPLLFSNSIEKCNFMHIYSRHAF